MGYTCTFRGFLEKRFIMITGAFGLTFFGNTWTETLSIYTKRRTRVHVHRYFSDKTSK